MKYARRLLAVLLCLLMAAAMLPVMAATDEAGPPVNPPVPERPVSCNHGRSTITNVSASCTQPSQQICTCDMCGETLWVERGNVPMGHYAGPYVPLKAPTCTEPGAEEQYCMRCGILLWTREIPALGHEFGEWIRVKEPTNTEPGIEERYCVRQDATQQRNVNIDDHINVIVTFPGTNTIVYPGIHPNTPTAPSEPDSTVEEPNGERAASATLVKYVCSSPENGMSYTPEEAVEYYFELVNTGDVPFRKAAIYDDMLGGSVSIAKALQPGERLCGILTPYVVSEEDAANGLVTNQGYAECVAEDGEAFTVFSNSVTVPAGFEPFGVISSLSITKTETSVPANGLYYQAGETISYAITVTNDGDTDLGETIIYDLLKPGSGEIGSAEMLHSGESRTFYFNWTVTDADVETGYVMNAALAEYDNGGYLQSAMSSFVISDTDGKLNDGEIPGTITTPITLPGEGDGYRACTVEITGRGDTGAEYAMQYCAIHDETRQTIDTMLDSAKSDAARTKAWKFAGSMWRTELDDLYDAMLEAADFRAALFVRYERSKFDAMRKGYEATLRRLNVDEGQIAMTMAEMARNKAVEMCYTLHTAPEARLDSLLHTHSRYEGIECEDCFRPVAEKDDGSIAFALQLCPEHAITAQMRDALLENSQEAAWENAMQLWRMDLQSAYAILRTGFDAEGKQIADTDFDAFLKWVEARQMLLTILYPKDTDTQLELLAYAFEDRVVDLCGLMKG